MCTAITYQTTEHYFGRNLDYDHSYCGDVVVLPRNYPLHYRAVSGSDRHYAIIGTALVQNDYPLFFDAMNEKGLSMAGLNFVGNAFYFQPRDGVENVAPFELIPWILSQCSSVNDARKLLGQMRLIDIPFSEGFPNAQLHWMLADRRESVTIESVAEGLRVYDNPVGVLTNNPRFEQQIFQLNQYMHLTTEVPRNTFAKELDLRAYSLGMGALGLPGDYSSTSRFVKAAFLKWNSQTGDTEEERVSQFFHILGGVEQPRGLTLMEDGNYEITLYSSCCNTDRGIYYYRTYENSEIIGVDMHLENLDGTELIAYPMEIMQEIRIQNTGD